MPLLAVDPGVHLGYALIPAGEVGVLVLPKDVEGAVRGMMEELRPLLLSSTDLVVEGWQVRGRRPGRDSLVPLALIGALVALGENGSSHLEEGVCSKGAPGFQGEYPVFASPPGWTPRTVASG